MTDQPMNPVDTDATINTLRRVAVMLGRHATATRLTITARGLDVEVASDEAAHRIVDPHPFRHVHSLVQMWIGVIGETPVTVHVVTATTAPAAKLRVGAA